MREPDTATDLPKLSPAAPSAAVSFASCVTAPSAPFSNTYADPELEPLSSSTSRRRR